MTIPPPPPPPFAPVPPPPFAAPPAPRRRSFAGLAVLAALVWAAISNVLASHAGRGIAERFRSVWLPDSGVQPLLTSIFFLFLVLVGFAMLQRMRGRSEAPIGLRGLLLLPKRSSAAQEWQTGAAVGWALAVLAAVPMLLAGALHVQLWTRPQAFFLLACAVLTLGLNALTEELTFRGQPYQRLSESVGVSAAALLLSLLFAAMRWAVFGGGGTGFVISTLFGILLAMAYSRTHALWLGWGLHFALNAVMAVVLGLRVAGLTAFSSVIETSTSGSDWLTGGLFGPQAAILMIPLLLLSMPLLMRLTREWSWSYTDKPIVPGGYAVEVAPSAAHTAMENEAAAKAPSLVQILPTTPQALSTQDYISQAVAADRKADDPR